MALLGFLLVSVAVAASMLFGALLFRVRARRESPLKRLTYECGEEPAQPAWMQFHARYYLVALFFVLFDIEAAFLLPWSVMAREVGAPGLVAVVSFAIILLAGWAWALRKGVLRWQ